MTGHQIRTKFLEFFASKNHRIIASDSVVPKDDPTVLFTTAGMQQFKRQFMGNIDDYTRATSSQKCIRTDDLDKVGKTAFHHTFFEMLGNFSFGDYFKKEAIEWAWEFLTQVLSVPAEKLWVSVYNDDPEAEKIWLETIKIPKEKLVRLGDHSNFWPADAKENGPNGPCGPCSEIFFDYGVNPKCPKKEACDPDCDCGRFAEIWNLVFTQFNRKDGGILEPLPAKNIDTGMGLERLTAVLQSKRNNFESDLFEPIISAIQRECSKENFNLQQRELFLLADHIRAIVFAISDGIIPSNKERGFVVKRLITDTADIILQKRRKPFMDKIVPVVVDVMKEAYPELIKKMNEISTYIQKTSEDYQKVFKIRIPELENQIRTIFGSPLTPEDKLRQVGEAWFIYRDTFGLTIPTIKTTTQKIQSLNPEQLAEVRTIAEELFEQQRERSRAASKMSGDVFLDAHLNLNVPKTGFVGHSTFQTQAKVLKIFKDDEEVSETKQGDQIKIILDQTPFYAESGGQVGDAGKLIGPKGRISICDTKKVADIFIHVGQVEEGNCCAGESISAEVEKERRLSIMRNHTATHLLQAALRKTLGDHVKQQGSLVTEDRLRFDFTHPKAVNEQQLAEVENFVNDNIMACHNVQKKNMSLEEAKELGALAFFAEKYGDMVRIVSIDEISKEFCGGTHLDITGQIGLLKIVSESAIAQGIRRIEAVTGSGALALIAEDKTQLRQIASILKAPAAEALERIKNQTQKIKDLKKEIILTQLENIKYHINEIIDQSIHVGSTTIVTHIFPNAEITLLRKACDLIKQKLKSCIVILGSSLDAEAQLLAYVSNDLIKEGFSAKEIIKKIAPIINGQGGGKPQLAQAGSKEPAKLSDAIQYAKEYLNDQINS